jgi:hypothetical protein
LKIVRVQPKLNLSVIIWSSGGSIHPPAYGWIGVRCRAFTSFDASLQVGMQTYQTVRTLLRKDRSYQQWHRDNYLNTAYGVPGNFPFSFCGSFHPNLPCLNFTEIY